MTLLELDKADGISTATLSALVKVDVALSALVKVDVILSSLVKVDAMLGFGAESGFEE